MADDRFYHEGMRALQDQRETRPLADRLEQVIVRPALTDDDRDFIARCAMVFVATADADGFPDCSYKGGAPGFVQTPDVRTIRIPDYDGNGMYRSWGNVLVNPAIGLLFIDFEKPKRLRVLGRAKVVSDAEALAAFPGAVFVIDIDVVRVFPNCPRYLHPMRLEAQSEYTPCAGYTPPVPGWKKNPLFVDALPERDRPRDDWAEAQPSDPRD